MVKKKFATLFALFLTFIFLLSPPSFAKNIIVSDAQDYVRYETDGGEGGYPAVATLRELFAKVVESGDVVYIGENWDTGDVDGNGEVDETWDTTTWLARFIVTEPIEISKDVEIYASCTSRRLRDDTIEVVNLTKEGNISDDLTTFEGKGKSQIFRITGGAKVTIANLRINGAYTGSANDGGAVALFEDSQVTIRNCIIEKTHSSTYEDGRSYGKGGGVYVNASRLTLQSSDIKNNTAFGTVGGGIAIENGAYALITNSTITSNDTPAPGSGSAINYGNGGGIIVMAGCSADIVDSVITKNIGNNGGGICVYGDSRTGISRVTLTGCTVSENTCLYDGGGIYVNYSSAAIANCTISDNTCTGLVYSDGSHHHGNGGGICVYQPQESLTVTDCVITGNSAYASGGGIDFNSSYTIAPIASNCLIAYNTAYNTGGGIAVNGTAEIDNFTIIGNKAVGYTTTDGQRWYGQGGGIGVSNSWLKMTNSTVTKNSAGYIGGGGIFYSGTVGMECMLSNCTIVDNSAENGPEIFRDGYRRGSRIPFINSLIYNTASPDKTIYVPNSTYDDYRSMFFNCAIPEELNLDKNWKSFDIVQLPSWSNPVSSTVEVNGVTHTVYKIENNPALKPIIGAGANRIVRSSESYQAALDYTSPSFDQLGITRYANFASPDIGAVEKTPVIPVLSADMNIDVVEGSVIEATTITDTAENKYLNWSTSGNIPEWLTVSNTKNDFTFSGTASTAGDYEFSVIASNDVGTNDARINLIVYSEPVLPISSLDINATVNQAFTPQTITATQGNHLAWTYTGTLPEGLTVESDDTSLTISGTPTAKGDHEVTFTASNLAGSAAFTANIKVYEVPSFTSNSITFEAVENSASTPLVIRAATGNHLTWTTDKNLPDGLTFSSDENSLTISGTPTAEGDYEVTFTASNYAGSANVTTNITVYRMPVLPSVSMTVNAVENSALTAQTIRATSGHHLTWTPNKSLPDGLTYTSSSTSLTISGTPTTAGDYEVVFTASNFSGSTTVTVNITVYSEPVLSSTRITINAVKDEAVEARTVRATSGNHLTWTPNKSLPDGLTYTANAAALTISGTPTAEGDYEVTFTASNYAGSANVTASINVYSRPALQTNSITINAVKNEAVEAQTVNVTSGNHLVWTVDKNLPEGLTVSSSDASLIISGTPVTEGDYELVFKAENFAGNAELKANINVYSKPALSSSSIVINAVENEAVEAQTVNVTSGNHLVWTVDKNLPEGLTVESDDTSLTISGTPTTAGDYELAFTASNFAGTAAFTANINVYSKPVLPSASITVNAVENEEMTSQTITATSGNHLAWTYTGTIPEGLTVESDDTSLMISGTPTTAGDYELAFTASNFAGTAAFTANINVYSKPVVSETSIVVNAVENQEITPHTITATSGNHLTWTYTGTIPEGLTVESDDTSLTISGTPTTAGDYELAFIVSNFAESVTATASITVYSKPVLSENSVTVKAVEGEEITPHTITATAGNHLIWTYTGTLPDGLYVLSNDNSFTIGGTPSEGSRGGYSYSVTASNFADSSTAEINVSIAVKNFKVDVSEPTPLSEILSGLTDYEIETIETLILNEFVTDLSGLDELPNLVTLDLTKATSLRVVYLDSRNTVLNLNLAGNTSVIMLLLIDSHVEKVNAEGCSNLEYLEVAGNQYIKYLNVCNTNLSVLNVEECSSLETLLCSSSNISEFYLKGCNNLTTLDFSDNAVRKFDARGFSALTSLDCGEQIITDSTLRRNFDFREFMSLAKVSPETLSDDEKVKNIKGYDNHDNEISYEYNSETGILAFSRTPYFIKYSYMATDDESIDVTISGDIELSAPVFANTDIIITALENTSVNISTSAALGEYLTWTTSGELPNGLTGAVDESETVFTISGTPSIGSAGTYNYAITASNTAGSAEAVVTITIVAPENISAPELFEIRAIEGTAITSLTITTNSVGNLSWSTSGTLPKGLSGRVDDGERSFTISGTPSEGTSGSYQYVVTARNDAGQSTAVVNINVFLMINPTEETSLADVIGGLTVEQAEAIESLAIGDNITDLSGLENLTNLTSLDLTEAASLTEVDLSGNNSVRYVDLSGNSSVTKLILSDSNVEVVNAKGCSGIDEVDIEGNTAIRELNISNTNITSLNAKGCENLEVLECSSSKISNFNLEGCVNLKILKFEGNAVRRFDAEGFTRLEELSCGNQEVTGQTLSDVFNLSSFINSAQVSTIFAASGNDKVKNVRGYDRSGKEIEAQYNSSTGEVKFSQVPSKITYDYETGFGNVDMDVTISGNGEASTSSAGDLGSSSGGCNGIFNGLMLLGMIFAFTVKKC